jgi:hypothetical protein
MISYTVNWADFHFNHYFVSTLLNIGQKFVCTNENKYSAKVYLMLKNDQDIFPNKKNWCSLGRDLLCNLGLNDAWFDQNFGNANAFLSLVKQRIKD